MGDPALSRGLDLICGAALSLQVFCDSVLLICARKEEFLKEELLRNASARKVGFLVSVNTMIQATKMDFLDLYSHPISRNIYTMDTEKSNMVAHLAT